MVIWLWFMSCFSILHFHYHASLHLIFFMFTFFSLINSQIKTLKTGRDRKGCSDYPKTKRWSSVQPKHIWWKQKRRSQPDCLSHSLPIYLFTGDITQKGYEKKRSKLIRAYAGGNLATSDPLYTPASPTQLKYSHSAAGVSICYQEEYSSLNTVLYWWSLEPPLVDVG